MGGGNIQVVFLGNPLRSKEENRSSTGEGFS
jgi:hypothetical protein